MKDFESTNWTIVIIGLCVVVGFLSFRLGYNKGNEAKVNECQTKVESAVDEVRNAFIEYLYHQDNEQVDATLSPNTYSTVDPVDTSVHEI